MTDPGLSSLLKWSVENSSASEGQPPSTDADAPADTARGLPAHALAALFGGPSDADLMRESMTAITSSSVTLPDKLIAFDNLEQLVENIDNANNLAPLGLWEPLAGQLRASEHELRLMAAWCVGTAAQNNVAAQERILILGIIPTLIDISINDDTEAVRRKAIFALSSCIRNYQPGLDAAQEALPADHKVDKKLDAADMASVDVLIQKLRDHSQEKA